MPFDRFLIAPINTGLQTDLKPWQIMDDAFQSLQNAYVFRGRVVKRFGSLLMGTPPSVANSRLRIGLGTTNGSGSISGTVPGIIFEVGQLFSVGTSLFTVTALGTPANLLRSDGLVATATFNTTTGAYVIDGAPVGTTLYYYPGLPVMGITQYESGAVNNHPSYAFDTQFAYRFVGPGWDRSGSGSSPLWHDPSGDQSNYFLSYNYRATSDATPTMFVTNFQVTNPNGVGVATDDPIWYTPDGSTWTALSGVNAFYFFPNGGAPHTGPFVVTARIIVAFHNRLILLNTIENDNSGGLGVNSNYVNRARYSSVGSPFVVNAWYEEDQQDNAGNFAAGAGFEDASTEEQIISAEFIKDHLIVYFERSTWELVYTYSEADPFIWRRLNNELGSQSTFSTVPFDTQVLTIGNTGVHACNGSNVSRIDEKIPDEIFDFESSSTQRTAGIRDYYTEAAYWAFVSDSRPTTDNWPNQVLVFNYRNRSWALNDDCITAFGYFEQQEDTTWQSTGTLTWEEFPGNWIDGILQSNQRQIIFGTPEGFVLRLARDVSRNAPSMQITNMSIAATGIITLTIINHNLSADPSTYPNDSDYILLENIVADATTELFLNGGIFPVWQIIDSNTISIQTYGGLTVGTYAGGGTAARVSNVQITTKQFNPYVKQDRGVYVAKIDFGVTKTPQGQITVDYFPSSTPVSMIQGGFASGAILGNSILETSAYDPNIYPLEQYQDLLWHPIYFQTSGTFVQFALYFAPNQMTNPTISLADFELQGMVLYTQPTSSRMQ